MRLLPIVPFVFAMVAFILGFLCIFAGNSPGFMQDYPVITLNVSRIGQDMSVRSIFDKRQSLLDSLQETASDLEDEASKIGPNIADALTGNFNLTTVLRGGIQDVANDATASIASYLGLRDFYAVHLMTYCQGYYTPGPVRNDSVDRIGMNITSCKDPAALFQFDAGAALVSNLNESVDGRLSDKRAEEILQALDWPDPIQDVLADLGVAFKAQFVMYCIAIAFAGLTMFGAVFWFLRDGRAGPLLIMALASSAFMFMAIASAINTAVSIIGANAINRYGSRVGIQGQRGGRFIALTWSATVLLFVAAVAGCAGCWDVRKRLRKPFTEKP